MEHHRWVIQGWFCICSWGSPHILLIWRMFLCDYHELTALFETELLRIRMFKRGLISFSFSHSWLVFSLISSVKACDWSADVRKSCSHWFSGFGVVYIQLVSFEGFIYYYYHFIWSFTCPSFLIPPSDRSLIPLTSWPIVSLDAPVSLFAFCF